MFLLKYIFPTAMSVLCSLILILVWIFNPKWRSLHNFISIHQIVFGSLQLCVAHFYSGMFESEILSSILLPASLSWSLSGTILAHARLVFLITGKISYGKRKAAAFSYATLLVQLAVVRGIVPNIFGLGRYNYEAAVAGVYFFMFLSFMISVKVMSTVVPCCKKRITRTGGTRILSLIGIAIVSDMIISLTMLMPFIYSFDFLFNHRLIAHTILVLCNKTSIAYFKNQRERRKQRALQELNL